MPEDGPEIISELLDDFYAECDEHLSAIRNHLVPLESLIGRPLPASEPTIGALFRSFHSLKGICAIVGLRPAEQLAHGCEDYLRALTQPERQITSAGYDTLTAGVQRLEQIVGAHREKQPLPDAAQQLAQIAAVVASTEGRMAEAPAKTSAITQSPKEDLDQKIRNAAEAGKQIWLCTFSPSAVLDQRGINVNEIRSRLAQLGTILDGAPKVGAGTITFQFVVATSPDHTDWSAWQPDGVTAVPYISAGADSTLTANEPGAPHTPFLAPSHVVRVDLARLDELMRIAGDLVVYRARLEQQIDQIGAQQGGNVSGLREVDSSLTRAIRDLREAIMRVRLVPAAEVFARLPFVARDLARETGKKVRVTTSGHETQVDKYVVERMKDPLLHLVRNAVSHGVETPQERVRAGKDETAVISLAAATAGDVVVIRISDDGRGIDRDKVRERAVAAGMTVPPTLDDATLLDIISSPGFSTRDEADLASGRGVGMAVVATTIRELGGTFTLESRVNEGTTFTLRLPLTLAILDAIIVAAGEQLFAVPQAAVQEIIQVDRAGIQRVGTAEVARYRDSALPLVPVTRRFGLMPAARPCYPVLVVSTDRGPVGLWVDRVAGGREVVVRPLRDPLVQVDGFSGATELGDGKPVLIVDALALARMRSGGRGSRPMGGYSS